MVVASKPTEPIDTVILAGGDSTRLRGVVARGLKPLVIVNGEAMIWRLIRQADTVGSRRKIVVASPTNVLPMTDIMNESVDPNIRFVVQPLAIGPADALMRGLELSRTKYTLVLPGDNLISDEDVQLLADCRVPAIGVRHFNIYDPYLTQLTRQLNSGRWVEKEPLHTNNETGVAWTGPLVLHTLTTLEVLERSEWSGPEFYIGPQLNSICSAFKQIEVRSVDIGDGSYKL